MGKLLVAAAVLFGFRTVLPWAAWKSSTSLPDGLRGSDPGVDISQPAGSSELAPAKSVKEKDDEASNQ
jgi:hypothetical protein